MKRGCDLAIVGSGFGGAVLAMVARRLGRSVILLERGRHPRFAIGESTPPLANLLLEELARRYDLPRLMPLTSFGSWQRTYPQLVCGLKRGFTFFHHQAGQPYRAAPDRSNQLLVAASPNDSVADMHWLRADVDHFLVQEAAALGAEYLEDVNLTSVQRHGDDWELRGQRNGQPLSLRANLVIDASGPRGLLSRALSIAEAEFENYPATQTLYSHFTGVRRCDQMAGFLPGADPAPPYPIDDAAVHHVFDGGWIWVLRFGSGVTSAGVALTAALARELALEQGEPAWTRLLQRFPSLADQFAGATAIRPFTSAPRLSYRSSAAAGVGWALLPSSAAFVDPLLSTGIPLTLLGIERLGALLARDWGRPTLEQALRGYGEVTLAEADWTARTIAACYAGFRDFPRFAAFSMFYFAAASFAEMARRFGREHLARRFLGADHPAFAAGLTRCAERLSRSGDAAAFHPGEFLQAVSEAIAPLNVAGLAAAHKHNWYDIDLDDLVRGADKLELSAEQVRRTLETAAWAQAAVLSG